MEKINGTTQLPIALKLQNHILQYIMINKLSLVILFSFTSFICSAQHYLSGRVVDEGNHAVENCKIQIMKGDSVINKSITNTEGFFRVSLEEGKYELLIDSKFYHVYSTIISIHESVQLNPILLVARNQQLDQIVISTPSNPVKQIDGGVRINISGTRLENKQNLLSIIDYAPTATTFGGLKIAGSDNILLLINNQEVKISKDKLQRYLSSIKPSRIRHIEIIDTPDSSVQGLYSAVIKITTKIESGLSGDASATAIFNDEWGYNGDAGLYYSTDKLRLYANYYRERFTSTYETKSDYILYEQELHRDLELMGKLERENDNLTLGFDYNFNENKKLSVLYLLDDDLDNNHTTTERSGITSINPNSSLDSLIESRRKFYQLNLENSLSILYNSLRDSLGSDFSLSFDYSTNKYDNPITQDVIYTTVMKVEDEHQQLNSNDRNTIYAIESKWNKIRSKRDAFAFGAKASFAENDNDFMYFNLIAQQWELNENYSNRFLFKEYIIAGYASYKRQYSDISSFSLGARAEYNSNDFKNIDGWFNNNNLRVLFTLAYRTRILERSFYIYAYNRLIRPNYNGFNPSYIQTSPTSAYMGNEHLKPTNIYNLQTAYSLLKGLSFTLRYSFYDGIILSMPRDVDGIIVTQLENAGFQHRGLAFLNYYTPINNWWELKVNVMGALFNTKLPHGDFDSQHANFSLSNNFYLPFGLDVDLNFNYATPYTNGYTSFDSNYSLSSDIHYRISKKWKISASVSDMLKTQQTRLSYNYNNINYRSDSRGNTRRFSFSVSYSFSKGKETNTNIRDTGIESEKNRR